ncbi:MAG: ubiquitin-like domain-containing protein, partial [Myxococcota bacterium]
MSPQVLSRGLPPTLLMDSDPYTTSRHDDEDEGDVNNEAEASTQPPPPAQRPEASTPTRPRRIVQVYVVGPRGREVRDTDPEMTVGELKAKLRAEYGEGISLGFENKRLDNERTLASYGIDRESTIRVNYLGRGGVHSDESDMSDADSVASDYSTDSSDDDVSMADDASAVSRYDSADEPDGEYMDIDPPASTQKELGAPPRPRPLDTETIGNPKFEARRSMTLKQFVVGKNLDPEMKKIHEKFEKLGILDILKSRAYQAQTPRSKRSKGDDGKPTNAGKEFVDTPLRDISLKEVVNLETGEPRQAYKDWHAQQSAVPAAAAAAPPASKRPMLYARGTKKEQDARVEAIKELDRALGIKSSDSTDGGFNDLTIKEGALDGRPNFSHATHDVLQTRDGEARRHMLPWHSMSGFTNRVISKPDTKAAMTRAVDKHVVRVYGRLLRAQNEGSIDGTSTREETLKSLRQQYQKVKTQEKAEILAGGSASPSTREELENLGNRMEEMALAD